MKKNMLLYVLILVAAYTAAQSPYTGGIGSGYQAGQSAFSSCTLYAGGSASGVSSNLSTATSCVFYFGGIRDGAASNQSAAVNCFPFVGGEGDGNSMNNSNCENEGREEKQQENIPLAAPANKLPANKNSGFATINIYPNPAQTSATLYYYSPRDFNTICTMYQNDGRVVMLKALSIKQGANYFRFDLQHAGNGVYFIRLSDVGIALKLVVQKR